MGTAITLQDARERGMPMYMYVVSTMLDFVGF